METAHYKFQPDVASPPLTKPHAAGMAPLTLQPITPEPWLHHPRAGDPALSSRPDSTTASTASPPSYSDGGSHCSEDVPSLDDPILDAEPAVLTARLAAAEAEASALRAALARQGADAAARLEADHEWAAATVQHATDVACSLRDANVMLAAEADALRSRVGQLEAELASLDLHTSSANDSEVDEGAEGLIAALQVEIADLERRLHRAGRARSAAAETEEAALQRAEILRQQVEHMAGLLEQERAENERLKAVLAVAGVLPPVAPQHA